jgi:hypothetical protein
MFSMGLPFSQRPRVSLTLDGDSAKPRKARNHWAVKINNAFFPFSAVALVGSPNKPVLENAGSRGLRENKPGS